MQVNPRRCAMLVVVLLATVVLPACETSPASPSESFGTSTSYRVTIALIGLDPSSLEVPVGARVMFVNNDTNFPHHMAGCPEIDAVGLLKSGQSGQTEPFASAKTCNYHDRLYPENPLRQGRIIVR